MAEPTIEWVKQNDDSYTLLVRMPANDSDDPDVPVITMAFLEESVRLDEDLGMENSSIEEVAQKWMELTIESLVDQGIYTPPADEAPGGKAKALTKPNAKASAKAFANLNKVPKHPKKERIDKIRKSRSEDRARMRRQLDSENFPLA